MAELRLEAMITALEAEGFDVIRSDVITARREDGERVWEVIVDRGGQLKVTITYPSRKPTKKSRNVLGRKLNMLTERITLVTGMTVLEGEHELPEMLKAIERVMFQKRSVS